MYASTSQVPGLHAGLPCHKVLVQSPHKSMASRPQSPSPNSVKMYNFSWAIDKKKWSNRVCGELSVHTCEIAPCFHFRRDANQPSPASGSFHLVANFTPCPHARYVRIRLHWLHWHGLATVPQFDACFPPPMQEGTDGSDFQFRQQIEEGELTGAVRNSTILRQRPTHACQNIKSKGPPPAIHAAYQKLPTMRVWSGIALYFSVGGTWWLRRRALVLMRHLPLSLRAPSPVALTGNAHHSSCRPCLTWSARSGSSSVDLWLVS